MPRPRPKRPQPFAIAPNPLVPSMRPPIVMNQEELEMGGVVGAGPVVLVEEVGGRPSPAVVVVAPVFVVVVVGFGDFGKGFQ